MKNLNLTVSTQRELSTHIQTICNEILVSKKNETVTMDKTIVYLRDKGFDLDSEDIDRLVSIVKPKQINTYEKLLSDRKPLLGGLCKVVGINMFDKNGNELDIGTLKKRVTNYKHRVSQISDTPTDTKDLP